MPYSATVIINEMEYGVGYGSSKKQAKSEAGNLELYFDKRKNWYWPLFCDLSPSNFRNTYSGY